MVVKPILHALEGKAQCQRDFYSVRYQELTPSEAFCLIASARSAFPLALLSSCCVGASVGQFFCHPV